MLDERQPLFCYCLTIGDREFAIQVTQEGIIQWDDYQERRRARDRTRHLDGGLLMTEPDEFTVSFALSAEMFERFRKAAGLFEAGHWTTEDERRLDQHLIPLCWQRVNPQLAHPLSEPTNQPK